MLNVQMDQSSIPTAILFWGVFLISIFLSHAYQKYRYEIGPNGNVKIKKIHKFESYFWTFLITIGPSILIGFRNYNVGADTSNIVTSYLNMPYINDSIFSLDRILYSIIRYISYIVSNGNPTFFLFMLSFLTLFILMRGLNKWLDKISIPYALFIYYALFGMQLLNQARQFLAISVLVYGLNHLLNNEKKYYLFVLIAGLIHFTAFIGLLFPLLKSSKNYFYKEKNFLYYLMLLFSPILVLPILTLIIEFLPATYASYIAIADYSGIGFGFFITIYPVILPLLFFKDRIKNDNLKYISRISLLIIPLRFAGYYSYFLMRLNYYASIFMVIILPSIYFDLRNKNNKRIFNILNILIFISYYIIHYMLLDAGDMFPYQFVLF